MVAGADAPMSMPRSPLAIELIEPGRKAHARPIRGVTIGPGGLGTILSAPERRLFPSPLAVAPKSKLPAEPPVGAQVAGLAHLFARLADIRNRSFLDP